MTRIQVAPPDRFAAAVAAVDYAARPPPEVPEPRPPSWWDPSDGVDPSVHLWRRSRVGNTLIARWVAADSVFSAWVEDTTDEVPNRLAHLAQAMSHTTWTHPGQHPVQWSCSPPIQLEAAVASTGWYLLADRPEQQPWVQTLVRWTVHTAGMWDFAQDRAWVVAPLVDAGIDPPQLDGSDELHATVTESGWAKWSDSNLVPRQGRGLNHGDQVLLAQIRSRGRQPSA